MKLRPDEREYKGFIMRAWKNKSDQWNVSIRSPIWSRDKVSSQWHCQRGSRAEAHLFGQHIVDKVYVGGVL